MPIVSNPTPETVSLWRDQIGRHHQNFVDMTVREIRPLLARKYIDRVLFGYESNDQTRNYLFVTRDVDLLAAGMWFMDENIAEIELIGSIDRWAGTKIVRTMIVEAQRRGASIIRGLSLPQGLAYFQRLGFACVGVDDSGGFTGLRMEMPLSETANG